MDDSRELCRSNYANIIQRMIENATGIGHVTDDNVYQQRNQVNKPLMQLIVRDVMLPESQIVGFENLVELQHLAQKKRPCLILMEHWSNFDIPCFFELLEGKGEPGKRVADSIVAVAGIKLNETSKLVLAFTEIFTRVVLFPPRYVENIIDPKKRKDVTRRTTRLNLAAIKSLMRLRKEGKIILVFPTGTRYRPWDPSTGRGLREIDSYLKSYSYLVTVAINGNTLLPNPNDNMQEDFLRKDIMIYSVSSIRKCSEFRHEAHKMRVGNPDPKQQVADRVMTTLAAQHEETEKKRITLLQAAAQRLS